MINSKTVVIILTMCTASISIPTYAGTTSTPVVINCKPEASGLPMEFNRAGDPQTQLSITMNGVWAEGYTQNGGIITAKLSQMDQAARRIVRETYSQADIGILTKTIIHVNAECIGSGKSAEFNDLGKTIVCDKGDGLQIELFAPDCRGDGGTRIDRKGLFTLTETRDDGDKKQVKVKQSLAAADKTAVKDEFSAVAASSSAASSSGGNKKGASGHGKCILLSGGDDINILDIDPKLNLTESGRVIGDTYPDIAEIDNSASAVNGVGIDSGSLDADSNRFADMTMSR